MRISVRTSNCSFESRILCCLRNILELLTSLSQEMDTMIVKKCILLNYKFSTYPSGISIFKIQVVGDVLDRVAEKATGTFIFKSACTFIWFSIKKRAILLKFQDKKKNGHSQWKFNYCTFLLSKLCYLNFNHRAIFLLSFLRFNPLFLFFLFRMHLYIYAISNAHMN